MRTVEGMNDEKSVKESNTFRCEIGRRIRQIREEQGLTRERLAEKADITIKFMYELETGKKGLSANTLLKIAKALSCSCDYLLLGVSRDENEYAMSQLNSGVLKEHDEKKSKLMMDILQLILELKEEMKEEEL